jgi:hypothetical protein
MQPDRPPGRKRNGPDITPGRSQTHSTTTDEAEIRVTERWFGATGLLDAGEQ